MAFNVATSYDSSSCQDEHGHYTKYEIRNSVRAWTSREWLAAMAMQGLLANSALFDADQMGADDIADLSFDFADAMLAYQDKENDNHSGGE